MRDDFMVRTTVDLDPDILLAVKEIAALRATTAGKVLSELARKALEPAASPAERNGVPLMPRRPAGSARPTLALVNRLRDEA
jgi:hypothetical protein